MEQEKLRKLFLITILIIVILFSIILYSFNTIEGMVYSNPYEPYALLNKIVL